MTIFYSDVEPFSEYSPVRLHLSPATRILNEKPWVTEKSITVVKDRTFTFFVFLHSSLIICSYVNHCFSTIFLTVISDTSSMALIQAHYHTLPIPTVLSTLADNPGDFKVWTISPRLQIRVRYISRIIAKVAISCRLDFPTIKFQIFCVVWATVNMECFLINSGMPL